MEDAVANGYKKVLIELVLFLRCTRPLKCRSIYNLSDNEMKMKTRIQRIIYNT